MVGQFAGNNNGIESSETKWETLNIIDSNFGFTELFLKGTKGKVMNCLFRI
jgi:hypothetical protein